MIDIPTEIAEAAARLRARGIVAFPTETVYGLGADALCATAISRIYEVKGRPSSNPLIIHVSNKDMARSLTTCWSAEAEALSQKFWPGPLTIVLPKADHVPTIATAGASTVAIRMPNHPVALALIDAFGGPLVGPSANPSGRISPTCAEHVRSNFPPEVVSVLDGGACRAGIESTVISLVGAPRILRLGVIGAKEIAQVLGQDPIIDDIREQDPGRRLESPGTSLVHYAPVKVAALIPPEKLNAYVDAHHNIAVIAITAIAARPDLTVFMMPSDAEGYASRLYSALHSADASHASTIVIEEPPRSNDLWRAIHDRLSRATAQRP